MLGIINASLSKLRTVILLFALLMVMGISSFFTIPKEAQPDVTIPFAIVTVTQEGISPEDADKMLVNPLYQELKGLEGLKEIVSEANEGSASLQLEFELGVDIDTAIDDAKDRVDRAKPELPEDASDPRVMEINLAAFPVMVVTLSGNVDDRVLYTVAEDLQERIEAIPGVLEAPIRGNREEVAEIIIDPTLMASYNLSHSEVYNVITNNNRLVTAGNLDTGAGRFAVKVPGLIASEQDILNLPVKKDGDTIVRFRDIATGQRTYRDFEQISRVNGRPAVTLEIVKRAGSNIIGTLDEVRATVETTQAFWPEGIEAGFTQDQSAQVRTTLNDLYNSVLLATFLVTIVILLALGIRSAILVGLAIPASFLSGILIIHAMGYTLNIVALFALILTVGILVDGAIVVTEYADRRLLEGANRRTAYREAATRMAWPIIASTATTLAVFIPLLFIPGIAGDFMKYLPITVLATLGSSLVVSLIVVPAFGMLFGKALPSTPAVARNIQLAEEGDPTQITGFLGAYVRMIALFTRNRVWGPAGVLSGVFGVILVLVGLFMWSDNGTEFFPAIDSEFGNIQVKARGNLSLAERDEIVREVEKIVLQEPVVKSAYTTVVASAGSGSAEDTIGTIQMEFVDWQLRDFGETELQRLVDTASQIAGVRVEKSVPAMGPTTGIDMQIEVVSDNFDDLRQGVDTITRWLASDERLTDVSNDLPTSGVEWEVLVDRQAATRFNADIASVGTSIQMVTTGVNVGSFRPASGSDELDIRLRYPYNGRELDQIDEITLSTASGQVPISNFIERYPQLKQPTISRTDGKLAMNVQANLVGDARLDVVMSELTNRFIEANSNGELPSNVSASFVGDFEEQQEVGAFMGVAFGIAIFSMLAILVTQFSSFYQAGLILTSVVFSTAGVLLGLLVTNQPFGIMMCGIGIVALAGIVVNNNIVLIDTFNVLYRQGLDARTAILRTVAQRFRPVMLTTVTTVLGLLPMMIALNIDFINNAIVFNSPSSQWWTQLSTAIGGGLSFATILTLVLTPCLLMWRLPKR